MSQDKKSAPAKKTPAKKVEPLRLHEETTDIGSLESTYSEDAIFRTVSDTLSKATQAEKACLSNPFGPARAILASLAKGIAATLAKRIKALGTAPEAAKVADITVKAKNAARAALILSGVPSEVASTLVATLQDSRGDLVFSVPKAAPASKVPTMDALKKSVQAFLTKNEIKDLAAALTSALSKESLAALLEELS